ncbi:hypothetical protein S7335_549 [Synechococcus sp. PCC 7335]|uniref:DUF6463 family protein n=1 Tax=Synechococcus sp. (strain ATCC 29403 / PCC 7335) TaxID=91464 RepID=UPI00017EB1BE|nr:hypothetical protein S7335_549 [Synechococcus sp. PCC 7335]
MLKIVGSLWTVVACIHLLFGLVVYWPQWQIIAESGWFNVIAPNPFAPIFDREDAFWFMMATPFLLVIGQLCFWAHQQKLLLPTSISIILLSTTAIGLFLMPVSGFWLLILPSIMMLYSSWPMASSNNSLIQRESAPED